MKKLICQLAMLLPCVSAWGFDAYFYSAGTDTPILSAVNTESILFNPTSTVIVYSDFTTSEIDNADLGYMLFRNKTTTAINLVQASEAPTVIVRDGQIFVEANVPIESVTVYSASGTTVASGTPATIRASIPAGHLAGGVYLVETRSAGLTYTVKIVK
ncbi:MAG: T9SS type A sorting domain-containing protein [Clostridium sp.]|nr:T9SS type A sorting domain-containing protein [Clostridium sp.]